MVIKVKDFCDLTFAHSESSFQYGTAIRSESIRNSLKLCEAIILCMLFGEVLTQLELIIREKVDHETVTFCCVFRQPLGSTLKRWLPLIAAVVWCTASMETLQTGAGSRATEVNELRVMPRGRFSESTVVKTVTPVAKWPYKFRNSLSSNYERSSEISFFNKTLTWFVLLTRCTGTGDTYSRECSDDWTSIRHPIYNSE